MQGRVPLREVEELLGLRFGEGPTTLAGFVATELGRMPEVGDTVWHAGVQLRVASMDRRRVREVEVALPRPGRRAPRTEVSEEMTHSGAIRARARLREWAAQSGVPSSIEPEQPEALPPAVHAEAPAGSSSDEPRRDPFGSDDSVGGDAA